MELHETLPHDVWLHVLDYVCSEWKLPHYQTNALRDIRLVNKKLHDCSLRFFLCRISTVIRHYPVMDWLSRIAKMLEKNHGQSWVQEIQLRAIYERDWDLSWDASEANMAARMNVALFNLFTGLTNLQSISLNNTKIESSTAAALCAIKTLRSFTARDVRIIGDVVEGCPSSIASFKDWTSDYYSQTEVFRTFLNPYKLERLEIQSNGVGASLYSVALSWEALPNLTYLALPTPLDTELQLLEGFLDICQGVEELYFSVSDVKTDRGTLVSAADRDDVWTQFEGFGPNAVPLLRRCAIPVALARALTRGRHVEDARVGFPPYRDWLPDDDEVEVTDNAVRAIVNSIGDQVCVLTLEDIKWTPYTLEIIANHLPKLKVLTLGTYQDIYWVTWFEDSIARCVNLLPHLEHLTLLGTFEKYRERGKENYFEEILKKELIGYFTDFVQVNIDQLEWQKQDNPTRWVRTRSSKSNGWDDSDEEAEEEDDQEDDDEHTGIKEDSH